MVLEKRWYLREDRENDYRRALLRKAGLRSLKAEEGSSPTRPVCETEVK